MVNWKFALSNRRTTRKNGKFHCKFPTIECGDRHMARDCIFWAQMEFQMESNAFSITFLSSIRAWAKAMRIPKLTWFQIETGHFKTSKKSISSYESHECAWKFTMFGTTKNKRKRERAKRQCLRAINLWKWNDNNLSFSPSFSISNRFVFDSPNQKLKTSFDHFPCFFCTFEHQVRVYWSIKFHYCNRLHDRRKLQKIWTNAYLI